MADQPTEETQFVVDEVCCNFSGNIKMLRFGWKSKLSLLK